MDMTGSYYSTASASSEILERLRLVEKDNRLLKVHLAQCLTQNSKDNQNSNLGGRKRRPTTRVQTYASQEERYQYRLETLEHEFEVTSGRIGALSSEQAATREIAERAEAAVFDVQVGLQVVREGRAPRRRPVRAAGRNGTGFGPGEESDRV